MTPRARNAPNDWPAVPVSLTVIVSFCSPAWPNRLAISPDSMAPAVRSTLRIGSSIVTGSPRSSAGARQLDQLAVEYVVDRMLLPLGMVGRFLRRIGLVEDAREVEPARLPVADRLLLGQQVGLADHLVEPREAHLGKQLAHLFGDVEQEVDDVLRLSLEALPAAPDPAWRRRPGRC